MFWDSLNNAFCYDSKIIVRSFVAVGVAINSHDVMYGKPVDTIYILRAEFPDRKYAVK